MFPGGKGGRCLGLTTLPRHVPIVLKSGSLSLLELSDPVKACAGIAFAFIPCRILRRLINNKLDKMW